MTLRAHKWGATTLATVCVVLGACGDEEAAPVADDAPSAQTTVTPPAATQLPDSTEVNGIISSYLNRIINTPSSVRAPDAATATTNQLTAVVDNAPRACRKDMAKVSRVIERTDLSGAAKRKRVLDAMQAVYLSCGGP